VLVGIAVSSVRDLLAGDTRWLLAGGGTALVLIGALAFVLLRKQATLGQLRVLEAIVFATVTLYLCGQTFAYGVADLTSPGFGPTTWAGMLLRFALLMIAYGVFVPNTPLRAAAGVVAIGAAPVATALLLRARNPELQPMFETAIANHLFETALLLGAAAGVAVFAAFLTGNLFDFAYEERLRSFYDLEEKIGSGGMGEVWRARHRTLSRPTALKLIREDRVDSDDQEAHKVLQRFEREAKATAALRSPHTIDVYDFGVTSDGHFYYAMEYLEGLDLETLVKDYGPTLPERAVHLLLQACDSLADAHEHGLTHRDIKPANLFLSRLGPSNDYIKLLDFGLVHQREEEEESERLTAEGTTSGTPAYMAPEMALNQVEIDGRADIYALGGVAYWLLTGKYVFDVEGGVAMIVEHVKTRPQPPSARTELPICPELDEIVMKCLEKDPADRYQSARELAAALASVPLAEPWASPRAAEWWDLHFPGGNAVGSAA